MPWCLGAGLAVSFPAGAGWDAEIGGNIAALNARPAAAPADLVPTISLAASLPPGALGPGHDNLIRLARLMTGNEETPFETVPDEIEPRITLKPKKYGFPRPDRSNKGDPFIGLRPTFDAKLRNKNSMRVFIANQQALSGDVLGFSGFRKTGSSDGPAPAQASPDSEPRQSSTPSSGGLSRRSSATLVSVPTARHLDGSTPGVSRAAALSSATPVNAGENVRVVSAPMLLPGAVKVPEERRTQVARKQDKPNYAALIAKANEPAQRKCLAQGIYFEARSESEDGQAAVAQVILNRVLSPLYPNSVCGVVFQNRHRYKACQFSFACEGKSLAVREQGSWAVAVRIAKEVLEGHTYLAKVGGSTHYHATYVNPRWAKKLKRMNKIGTHIFYKLKPGQT
ncbi:MAG: cell wall hydrolase [Beijerinckiaceae bacterium]